MAFSKSFPRTVKGSSYPEWVDVYLSQKEERYIEESVRQEIIALMKKCISDAKGIFSSSGIEHEESDITDVATKLFDKLASHAVHAKERRCKDKFDRDYSSRE